MTRSRSSASRPKRSLAWASLVLLAGLAGFAQADDFPSIDFDLLGAVGVSGSFAGVEIWNQTRAPTGSDTTFDPLATTLLSRASNGTLSKVTATERGGRIRAICQLNSAPNTVFVGGNFFSIQGTSVNNIASFDPQTKVFDNLAGGLDGDVLSLYCDDEHQQVIAGGSFTRPVNGGGSARYQGAVASWSLADRRWNPVNFGGLNGTVNTVSAGSNSSLVRFGGEFETRFAAMGPNGTFSGTNTSASSLTDVLTPLSLGQVEFVGGPSSSDSAFNNPAQILCPQGPDGPGNSYLFQDNAVGRLTARAFRSLDVRAIRLGNTFFDGRGTRTFGIVSIPDNTQLELIYLDPNTNRNVTCTNDCVLYHDPSIPYQDFLISDSAQNNASGGVKTLTGIEFTANDFYGASAGLHALELLSTGGWAYAYNALNRGSCSSSEPGVNGTSSTATTEGGWYQSSFTSLAGTTEPALALTDSYSNLQSNTDASVTWAVDIPVNGNYTVNLFVPGCSSSGQCGERTTVNVNVFPVAGSNGELTRVDQTNQQDQSFEIYSGEIQKAADGFEPTIILSVPSDAPAPSGGGQFTVIADKVSFVLRDSNETLQMSRQTGFGVVEFNLFDDAVANIQFNGTTVLPNTTMTSLSTFSTTMLQQGVRRNQSEFVTSIAGVGGKTFVGGSFTSDGNVSFANIAAYEDSSQGREAFAIAGGGLNAAVNSLVAIGEFLFVGGRFTGVTDDTSALSYVARYDPRANSWAALGGGPDGPVSSLSRLGDTLLLVTGDFDTVNGTGQAGGYAVWDTATNAWQTQKAFLSGSIDVGAGAAQGATANSYIAGSVRAFSQQSASGSVELLEPNKTGDPPIIEALNYQFSIPSSETPEAPAASSSVGRRRSARADSAGPNVSSRSVRQDGSLASRLLRLLPRDEPQVPVAQSLLKRADAMVPASLASSGSNEVLASAFWQRDDGSYVNIIGGNFTTTAGIRNLAMYDMKTDLLTAIPSPPAPDSNNPEALTVIRSLLVDSDVLYAGGDGGIEVYDLKAGTWSQNVAPLSSETGQQLSVTSINHRPDTTTIVVAGNFDSAGSLPCMNVCQWDTSGLRWTPLGAGINGQISTVDFAGSNANQLIVAGSVELENQESPLASYNFDTQVWSLIGSVGSGNGQAPGPATAASVDDLNANSIFVAGRTSDGTQPYLARWDGSQYQLLGNGELLADTGVAQLTFVPLSKAHPGNSVLENNRLLVVSGALSTQTYGNISSLLFDGQNFTPFLVATNLNGSPGVVRSFSRSTEVLKFPNLHRLAVGLVILISIAIGLGIVFLLVLIGLIWALSRRRPEQTVDVPISASDESLGLGEKKRPSSLLATLNAATESAMLGGGAGAAAGGEPGTSSGFQMRDAALAGAAGGTVAAGAAGALASSSSGHGKHDSGPMGGTHENSDASQYHSDAYTGRSQYATDEGEFYDAAAAAAGVGGAGAMEMMAGEDDSPGSEGIPAHARYDFVPNHESELGVVAGESIEILDDQDEHWWLARNAAGQTGVIPSTYVL